jgi:dimethylargininase
MRVFDFDRAIVRAPGLSVVSGIRSDAHVVPRYAEIANEHAIYVAALRAEGIEVDVLAPLEAFPDSVFVEDPALVLAEGAILLRPGAPSRLGERAEMSGALKHHFGDVLELDEGEYVDGGDVLVTPGAIFIGMSRRTNRAGAEALRDRLASFGRDARIVQTPEGILHFKTASSLLSEDTILATKRMADSGVFAGFKIVVVPDGEDAAANALRVNDVVFAGAHYPRTIDRIANEGLRVRALPVSEIAKLDAGLSCMSLRWWSGRRGGTRSR